MKTYLLDSFNRYKRFSEELDARTILCNKSWKVFNDTGVKELFIFQEDGTLIISQDGIVTNAVWKYIAANRGIIISTKNESYLLHPAFADNNIFALQQDGTQLCLFMVDEQSTFSPLSLADLNNYFKKRIS